MMDFGFRRGARLSAIGGGVLCLLTSAVSATPIDGNPTEGLLSPASTVLFNEIAVPNYTVFNSQYAGLGIASASGLFFNGCATSCITTPPTGAKPELSNFNNEAQGSFTSAQTITFTTAVHGAAFQFATNTGVFTFTALLSGNVVESFTRTGPWGYYGFSGIALDEIQITSTQAYLLDNLQTNEACSNGVVDPGEECDDANTVNGDGCTVCEIDDCFSCSGAPSTCVPLSAGAACPDDGNDCTTDSCDGAGTCTHPGDVPTGTACLDDGNDCTTDTCDGAGTCSHPAAANGTTCADDGEVCTSDVCDGAGSCSHPGDVPAGTACPDDGSLCTVDQCDGAGTCAHSSAVDCDALNQCYPLGAFSCDPQTGTCQPCPAGYTSGGGGCQKIYAIDASLLDNLVPCGVGERYNDCSGAFGFHWTDTGDAAVGAVIGVDLQIEAGLSCTGSARSVALNGNPVGTYAAAGACTCDSPHAPRLLSASDITSYVKGGANSVLTDDPGNCEGLSEDTDGYYAIVTVTYQSPPPPLPVTDGTGCDDASTCTQTDTCQAGACIGTDPLDCDDANACTSDSCDATDGCLNDNVAASGCLTASKSILLIKDSTDNTKDKLLWKWIKGAELDQTALADPLASAGYALCVYTGATDAPFATAVLLPGPSWSAIGTKGYKFKGASPNGLSLALLKGGTAGKSKALAKGKGAALPDATLPVAYPVTVQLRKDGSPLCLESTFTVANEKKNTTTQFKAKQ